MNKDSFDNLNIEINIGSAIAIYASSKAKKVSHMLKTWRSRIRTRSELRNKLHNMNIEIIEKDVGLEPGSLEHEAHKPFWKA